ncbi:MAG TPA: iron-sulfur cluster insertion protein ErpA [Methylococcaceae bacterium]|jgi:iron-sulfur cluster insertion protein|nr:iron-sulfur cluster insertion protein ErpA [Methylococcaceae bacterium]HIA45902.1 iron-sulfur cluster insertion protein ErpA [Methylococcaceae bacterium]HIB63058.1 iron-sulfur cluster insertion protein ErpA [Methylococcaceae bacterium]HIN68226.1 iron-sulfur cluster insertion protein ErpA [Methylococcales bacterium]HIO45717.1 iron-sulfur cluster insertion protein ErpA [Methylococcales bacterium]
MTRTSDPFVFSDNAAKQVSHLIAEEGNDNLKLRVYITGGGCSGFQYGFTFDEEENEDDTSVINEGVKVLIDAMSIQYLAGAEIDYKEDITGSQFVIRNPNAATTCGCGSSFSV